MPWDKTRSKKVKRAAARETCQKARQALKKLRLKDDNKVFENNTDFSVNSYCSSASSASRAEHKYDYGTGQEILSPDGCSAFTASDNDHELPLKPFPPTISIPRSADIVFRARTDRNDSFPDTPHSSSLCISIPSIQSDLDNPYSMEQIRDENFPFCTSFKCSQQVSKMRETIHKMNLKIKQLTALLDLTEQSRNVLSAPDKQCVIFKKSGEQPKLLVPVGVITVSQSSPPANNNTVMSTPKVSDRQKKKIPALEAVARSPQSSSDPSLSSPKNSLFASPPPRRSYEEETRRLFRNPRWKPYHEYVKETCKKKVVDQFIDLAPVLAGEDGLLPFWKGVTKQQIKNGSEWAPRSTVAQFLECRMTLGLSDWESGYLKRWITDLAGKGSTPSLVKVKEYERKLSLESLYSFEVSGSMENPEIVIALKDIQSALSRKIQSRVDVGKLNPRSLFFKATIVGDKGAKTTKLGVMLGDGERTNATANFLPIAVYTGSEKQDVLLSKLSHVVSQLNNLEKVAITDEKGDRIETAIQWSLTGDCAFQAECYGHKGSASTHPCYVCMHKKDGKTSKQRLLLKDWDINAKSALRHLESYKKDSENGTNGVREGTTVVFSQVPLENIIPPSLHIIMGVFDKYIFKKLLELAMIMDSCTEEEIDAVLNPKQRDLQLFELEQLCITKKECLSVIQENLRNAQLLCDVFHEVEPLNEWNEHDYVQCRAENCVVPRLKEMGYSYDCIIMECRTCHEKVHAECSAVVSADDRALLEMGLSVRQCFKCRGLSELKEFQQEAKLARDSVGSFENEKVKELEAITKSITNMTENDDSPYRFYLKALEKVLYGDLKLVRKSRHGGCFNGNDTRKILRPENISKICSVFPKGSGIDDIEKLMQGLGKIMSLAKADILQDVEIESLALEIKDFAQNLKTAFPDETITLKLHLLVSHVIPYVEHHRTWGLTSEQAVERFHNVFTALEKRYSAIRNPRLRYVCIIRRLTVKADIFDHTIFTSPGPSGF